MAVVTGDTALVTSTDILQNFASRSAVKDADQFLLAIIGANNSVTLAKVGADVVKAYLNGNVSWTSVIGTLDGDDANLQDIISDLRQELSTKATQSQVTQIDDDLAELIDHAGLRHFAGFVNNVKIEQTSSVSGVSGVVFDLYHKIFLGVDVFSQKYYMNWLSSQAGLPSDFGDPYNDFEPWKWTVYKFDLRGMSYMWDGRELVALTDITLATEQEVRGIVADYESSSSSSSS